MKLRKRWGIFVALIIAALLWSWRYTSLNAYYDSINTVEEKVYQKGAFVPFGDDYTFGDTTLDGYSIRVDGIEIMEFQAFCQVAGVTEDDVSSVPDRVALVTITLFNESNDTDAVALVDFNLHGVDSTVGMNWELLSKLNPVLEGIFMVRIEKGAQYQFVLPYNINQRYFGSYTWNNMDNYDWFLRITTWPTKKDIAING